MQMTPKLQELANEAWQFAQQEVPFTNNDSLIEHANRREAEMAKFSELLIRECASIAGEAEENNYGVESVGSVYYKILEHFGV